MLFLTFLPLSPPSREAMFIAAYMAHQRQIPLKVVSIRAHGKARIRVMISAAHSKEDLDMGLEAFKTVGRNLGVI